MKTTAAIHASITVALLHALALGQAFEPARRVTNTVMDPQGTFAGDLDGDGDVEPIAISGQDGQISYWDNRGGGNFGPQVAVPFAEVGLTTGAAGDLDGNGAADIIVGTAGGDLVVFLGDSSGGWTRALLAQGAGVTAVACKDLNGDGIKDVLALSAGVLEWFEGSAVSAPLPKGVLGLCDLNWIEAVDLDADSDVDVLLSNSAVIEYLENGGTANFSPRSVPVDSSSTSKGHLVDVDGDGLTDIVRYLGGQVTWDRGLPGGGFGTTNAQLGTNFFGREFLRLSNDIDANGEPELWSGYFGGSAFFPSDVEVLRLVGAAPPPIIEADGTLPFEDAAPWDNAGYADYFGDARSEFARRSTRMVVEDLTTGVTLDLGDWSGQDMEVVCLDFNRDGRRDLIGAGPSLGEFSLFLGLGSGQFARRRVIGSPIGPSGASARPPVLMDADLDGDLDLAFAYSGTQFAWYEISAAGLGTLSTIGFPASPSPSRARAVDMDGDGDEDLLLTTSSAVSWFQNFGVAFGPQQVIHADNTRSAAVGDIDGDGLLDLVVTGQEFDPWGAPTDFTRWYRGLGAGGFVLWGNLANANGPFTGQIQFKDISGDGLVDVVTPTAGELSWRQNFGNGLFGPNQLLIPTGIGSVAVADSDADGDLDLLAGALDPSVQGYFLRNLGGVFAPPIAIPGPIFGEGPAALVDVDGDGDLDGLFSSTDDVGWSENLHPPLTGIGSIYCSPGVPNSTGRSGRMRAAGSPFVADQDLTMLAVDLPASSFGFFITSQQAGFAFPVSNSEGALCVTGSIGRYVGPGQIQNSGPAGEFSLALDLNAIPSPTGFIAVTPGETWNFQAWHRDASGGQTTSNFTDAVAVTFQ